MTHTAAWGDLAARLIVALAAAHCEVAASVGCALSRARTSMRADEMTCALPAVQLAQLVAAIDQAAQLDRALARYTGSDAQRFERT
jgi:hypothetical protein